MPEDAGWWAVLLRPQMWPLLAAWLAALFALVRLGRAHLLHRAPAPGSGPGAPVGALTPEELGFLAGGPLRAAETALTGLALAGRIRLGSGGRLERAAPPGPSPEDSEAGWALLRTLGEGPADPAAALSEAAAGEHPETVRRLAGLGLYRDDPRLPGARAARAGALRLIGVLAALLVLWSALQLAAAPLPGASVRWELLGAVLLLCLLGAAVLADRTAGRPEPRTAAGSRLLAEERAAVEIGADPAVPLRTGEALRFTALTGFAAMADMDGAPPPRRGALSWPTAPDGAVAPEDLLRIAADCRAPGSPPGRARDR
ncbi:TIGR04222 domain-containing membrane protein [Nocardiopsis potens]|uniref:TIGR04222 domain-containing membrane protein n=1 Tax=Nocardiopsis potens TaxID=1246458 RepID=UPI000345B1C5|nr:TIGR04222 domain-containing membrane protein [Nocardiopsis potens]